MGIDYNADLGYGIRLYDEELVSKINEEEIKIDEQVFRTIWAGDAYSGEMDTFLVIKESRQAAHSWDEPDEPISPDKLIAKPDWDEKLLSWCKEHDITDPKIGWWLCSSVS
jgi:hypothetical protein